MRETAAVCTVPLFAGILLGILLSSGTIQAVNQIADQIAERHEAVFQYHPLIFLLTLLTAAATVFLSAWIPAAKLSRTTPLAAIVGTDEWFLKKKRKSPVLALLFGIEGRTGRECPEGPEEGFSYLDPVAYALLSGFHHPAVLFYPLRYQHKPYLF